MRDVQKLISLLNNGAPKEDVLAGLEALNQRLSYGLFWDEDHPENVETFDEQSRGAYPVIKRNHELSLAAKDGKRTHLLVEGDNYHALSVLAYTHANSVDLVLIDPPYNTGEDFIYNDHRVIKSDDPFKSTKWLTFMKKRLTLAKSLLKPNGLIFVCIDDNEHATLKLLMDSIFPGKFVTTIHVEMSTTQGMKVRAAQNGNIVKNGEYILVYAMDGRRNVLTRPLYEPREFDDHYSYWFDEKTGEYCSVREKLTGAGILNASDRGKISHLYSKVESVRSFIHEHADKIFQDGNAKLSFEGFDTDKVTSRLPVKFVSAKGELYWLIRTGGGVIRQLMPLASAIGPCDDFNKTVGLRKIRGDWWPNFYRDMMNVSKEGGVEFPNGKKPLRLFKQIIDATTPKDGVVLDFFAGSGTTLHAVAALNAESPDDTRRQAIIVTNNEANICREKTHPRCLNALNESELGEGLAFFETAFIPKVAVSRDEVARRIGANCLDILCVKTQTFAPEAGYTLATSWAVAKGADRGVVLVHGKPTSAEFAELKKLLAEAPVVHWNVFAFSYDSSLSDPAIARRLGVSQVSPIPSELTRIFKTAYGF